MTWQIAVDEGTCIGSGMCAALDPGRFTLDGAHATVVEATAEPDDLLLDVADSCPMMAITVTDGGVEVGPRP